MFSYALGDLGKFGWSAAFIYVACAALRLARFNTQIDTADKHFFTGLASPSAAVIIVSAVWVCSDLGWTSSDLPRELAYVLGVLTAVIGFMMIAVKWAMQIDTLAVVMILVVFVFGLVTLDPPLVLLIAFLGYAISGPIMLVVKRSRS